MSDALPEQSTTPVERAQWDYDHAVRHLAGIEEKNRAAHELLRFTREKLEAEKRAAAANIPVDRAARTLTDGSPVTEDHRDLQPNGQQKGYVVLSDAERAKGFVRPVRNSYIHEKCGAETRMGSALAETYARDPYFYSGTFCVGCGKHFPVGADGEFVWSDTKEKVGT